MHSDAEMWAIGESIASLSEPPQYCPHGLLYNKGHETTNETKIVG